jgi:Bacterial membrane protein YfhO
MRHRWSIILVLACFATLFLTCYHPVLFQGRQFGFRDAAHFYYPLYQRVQQEWNAGRVPLWEMEENAGMPLLGNPTAAVLYPLKLVIYGLFPYAWGARLYTLAHTVVAFASMLVLMRSWGTSWTGSGLSALAYAFGAPVLFQYCNIIYLVGAAWLPLGVHAVDRWVRCGRRWALLELAVVLSMQTLGGEPQSAYLLGLAGVGYAAGLAWERSAARRRAAHAERGRVAHAPSHGLVAAAVAGLLVFWVVATVALASWVPRFRVHELPPKPLPWMSFVPPVVNAAWAIAALGFLWSWRRQRRGSPLAIGWLGLAGAAGLAVALSAAQFLPMVEFTQQTIRAAESGAHEIYPFSVEPLRLAGLIWPDVLGSALTGSNSWGDLVRLPGTISRVWVPSLYVGGLTFVLALGSLSFRRGAPWRVWLSVIVVVSAVGSLGIFTSPIWAARALADAKHAKDPADGRFDESKTWPPSRPFMRRLGPLDPEDTTPIRQDDFLRDGDGSIYWLMATLLPGFRQFRYPAKLFTLTSLGLAALAGLGWDAVGRGCSRRTTIVTALMFGFSVILLVGVGVFRSSILAAFRKATATSYYGPFDPAGAYAALVRGLGQGAIVLGLGLLAIVLAKRRLWLAGPLVLAVATADLIAANSHYVLTVPQSQFETQPEILRIIEEAERDNPQPGPYRVHRLPSWAPFIWSQVRSPDRDEELVRWERDTLQPKYGIPLGVEYAHVVGVAELYELEWYYGGFNRTVREDALARLLNVAVGDQVVYFPRRAFDMWNVRYFIVPMWPNGWTDGFRGYASMLIEGKTITPPAREFQGPDGEKKKKDWYERMDYRIIRNQRPHPRAWVVHRWRTIEPTQGMKVGDERQKAMQEICYENDLIWHDQNLQAYDPSQVVWIENDQREALIPYFSGALPRASESVRVTYPSPKRVELDVDMESPGMVVLADVYYPGWELTDNGKPAPIYQANRAMRGAAVTKGHHHLVYSYAPGSFRIGLIVSALGLVTMALAAVACWWRPEEPALVHAARSSSEELLAHE